MKPGKVLRGRLVLGLMLTVLCAAGAVAAQNAAYHGNVGSHVFHRPGCRHYQCARCTAVFQSREAAIAAGYRPCGVCRP